MKTRGLNDVLLFGGGIIPDKDIAELKNLGVGELFTPGAPTQTIVDYLRRVIHGGEEKTPGEKPTA